MVGGSVPGTAPLGRVADFRQRAIANPFVGMPQREYHSRGGEMVKPFRRVFAPVKIVQAFPLIAMPEIPASEEVFK